MKHFVCIAYALGVASKNRRIFQPGLTGELTAKDHTVHSFFWIKQEHFVDSNNKKESVDTKQFVVCRPVKQFCEKVQEMRNADFENVKIGIDGGGGFLKICVSLQSEEVTMPMEKSGDGEKQRRWRTKYEDATAAKKFKYSGVKKLFIPGLGKGVQENYDNVSKLWLLLQI